MRSFVPGYQLEAPPTLSGALRRLATEPGVWKPFAGGTDLMVLLEAGKLVGRKFLSIWKIPELKGIGLSATHVTLGALTTYSEVRRSDVLAREFPLLVRAAAETGSIATQNRGTIGGNIANASPAADTPPALLVHDAELELVSANGTRVMPYQGFWKGYKQLAMREDELIRAVRLPREAGGWKYFYRKVGTRRAQAISKVCFAGVARMEGGKVADVRIAVGSVAPVVLRLTEAEKILRGERLTPELLRAAQDALVKQIAPIGDIRSTAHYRLRVAHNVLAQFFESLSV